MCVEMTGKVICCERGKRCLGRLGKAVNIFLRKDERWLGVAVDEEQGLKDTGQGRSSLASTV